MLIKKEAASQDMLRITWDVLFPQSFRTALRTAMKKRSTDCLKEYLHANEGEEMQKVIVRMLIPKKYRMMPTNVDFTEREKSQFSRYFTYYHDNFGQDQYNTVKKHILLEGESGKYNFASLPYMNQLKKNLQGLFNFFPQDKVDDYETFINSIIERFEEDPVLKVSRSALLQENFFSKIACLTAIASTWHCWVWSSRDAEDLALFILPAPRSRKLSSAASREWVARYIDEQKKSARAALKESLALYEQGRYIDSVLSLSSVIKMNYAEDKELGCAYYYLALCCLEHKDVIKAGKKEIEEALNTKKLSPRELLKKAAVEYGNADALYRLHKDYGVPEPVQLLRPIANTHGTARIILNASNRYTDEFLRSIPEEMQSENARKRMLIAADSRNKLEQAIDPEIDCRFLLFDNSADKNFQDLLFILNKISALEKESASHDTLEKSVHWYRTSVYMRVPEEKYAALIDTALKRIGDFTVQVFVIDDNKWPAQYLLNQHPLFKPFAHLPADKLKRNPVTVNFTIISDRNKELSCWLMREAYWLGCFSYAEVTLAINLISSSAESIEKTFRLKYPDMLGELPDTETTSKVSVSFKPVDGIASCDVLNVLEELNEKQNVYNYYVINTGNDIDNLNLAIQLREWSIRSLIRSGAQPSKAGLPVIAFYCQDSDISYMGKNLVVQNIDSGNQWFNNYNVIPFGMLCDRYSWDKIDGGYLEKIAQSTHLQYCGLSPSESFGEKLKNLKDYFSRCYNRDSSMAVALSMPYRLFQTEYGDTGHITSEDAWALNSWSDEYERMAEEFKNALSAAPSSKSNTESLLNYEHSRWLRWAISRGWKRATPEEVLTYMKAGNPKHLLYIARMHGCICSLADLKKLSSAMCDYAVVAGRSNQDKYADCTPLYSETDKIYNEDAKVSMDRAYVMSYKYSPKDFISIDRKNIEQTGEILTAAWFPDHERVESSSPTKELSMP